VPVAEVIVTAQKRAQAAQDVPLTMQAYSAAQLQEFGVTQASDLAKFTPGLNTAGANAGQTLLFAIRGVVQQDFGGQAESPVATYVDDGYIATNTVVGVKLFDIDHVEVLKGPQGTLFGRNATGGVVNIFSKQPTDIYDGYAEIGYGSYDNVRAQAAFGGPLSDTVKFRVAALFEQNGAWVNNVSPVGQDVGADQDVAVRAHLEYEPSADTDILFTGYFSRSHYSWGPYFSLSTRTVDDSAGNIMNSVVVNQPTLLGTQPSDAARLTIDANDARDTGGQSRLAGGTIKATWNLGGPVLTSITDAKSAEDGEFVDDDGSPVSFINSSNNGFASSLSQELRLYGDQGSLRWYTGAFYLHIRAGMDPNRNWIYPANSRVDDWYTLRTNSYSGFGQVEYDLDSKWTLVGGLRVTQEKKNYQYNSEAFSLTGMDLGPSRTPYHGDESFTLVTAKGELDYHLAEHVLLYGGWNRGAKAGSFNAPFAGGTAYPDSGIPYKPEILNAFEVGEKSTLVGGTVQLNAAAFYYNYQDYQAFKLIGLSTQVQNNPAKVYGGELALLAHPVPHLTTQITASYTHDRVYDVSIGEPELLTRVAPYTSAWKWSALAKYDFKLPSGTLSVEGDVQHTGQFWFSLSNYDVTRVDGYDLLNARLTWTSDSGAWEVSLFGENLADKRYETVGFDLSALCGCTQVGYGRPRWLSGSIRRNL
jgi:iron complex outermembrane recepter protein